MTLRHTPRRPRRGLALLTATAAAAGLAASAGAASWNNLVAPTGCGYATSQVFAAFGDTNQYYLAPGGNAETTPAWPTSGSATLAAGKGILGTGSKVFALKAGASVTSPSFCVSLDSPTLRFSVKDPGVSGAALRVDVLGTSSSGSTYSLQIAKINSGKAGVRLVDPSYLIANLAALLSSSGTTQVQLRFTSESGSWQVDDISHGSAQPFYTSRSRTRSTDRSAAAQQAACHCPPIRQQTQPPCTASP